MATDMQPEGLKLPSDPKPSVFGETNCSSSCGYSSHDDSELDALTHTNTQAHLSLPATASLPTWSFDGLSRGSTSSESGDASDTQQPSYQGAETASSSSRQYTPPSSVRTASRPESQNTSQSSVDCRLRDQAITVIGPQNDTPSPRETKTSAPTILDIPKSSDSLSATAIPSNDSDGASIVQLSSQSRSDTLQFHTSQQSTPSQDQPGKNGNPSAPAPRITQALPGGDTLSKANEHEIIEILDDSDTDNDLQLALKKKTQAKEKGKKHQDCPNRRDTSSIGPPKFTIHTVGQLFGSHIKQVGSAETTPESQGATNLLDGVLPSKVFSQAANTPSHPLSPVQTLRSETIGASQRDKRPIDLHSGEESVEHLRKKARTGDSTTSLPWGGLKEKPNTDRGDAALQALQALRDANHQSRLTTSTLSRVKAPDNNRPTTTRLKTESQARPLPKRPGTIKSHGTPAVARKDAQPKPPSNHLQAPLVQSLQTSGPALSSQPSNQAAPTASAPKPFKLTAAFLESSAPPRPPPPKSLDQAAQLYRSFEAKRPEKPKAVLQASLPEPGTIEAAAKKAKTRTEAVKQRGLDRQAERKKKEYLSKLKTVYPNRNDADIDRHAEKLVNEWKTKVCSKKPSAAAESKSQQPIPVQKFVKPSVAAKLPVNSDQPVVLYTVYVSPRHKEGEAWEAKTIRGESFLDKAPANKRAIDLAEQCRSGRNREPRADVESMAQDYGGSRDGMFYGTIRFRDGSRIYVFVDRTNQLFGKLDQALIHGKDLKDDFLEKYEMRWDVMVFKQRRAMTPKQTAAADASDGADIDSQEQQEEEEQEEEEQEEEEESVVEEDEDKFLDISHAGAYTNAHDANVRAVEAFKEVLKLPPRLDSAGFMFYRDEILPLAKELLESDFRFKKDGAEISYGPLPAVCGYDFEYVYIVVSKNELQGPIELGKGLLDETPDKMPVNNAPSASDSTHIPPASQALPVAQEQEAARGDDTRMTTAADSSESEEE